MRTPCPGCGWFEPRLPAGLALALAIACTVGCGNGRATVSGRITFNGEPVSRGAITLVPRDGKGQSVGAAVEGGSYLIRDVLPGEKTVQIIAIYSLGQKPADDGSSVEVMGDLLPASWGPESQHTLTVTAPKTSQDFAIEGPDPRKPK
jgi:hypothetical protein